MKSNVAARVSNAMRDGKTYAPTVATMRETIDAQHRHIRELERELDKLRNKVRKQGNALLALVSNPDCSSQ